MIFPDLAGQQFPPATLYMVATPIGNLGDITLRAVHCLALVDAVAAEDTRMAQRLLAHFGIEKPRFSIHRHNEHASAASVLHRLAAGERVAYVSDAGTPAVADPGTYLVRATRSAGFRVMPIPGVSAATCALSVAGLREGPFHFYGFLPSRAGEASTVLLELARLNANIVLYEAPHRILESLERIAKAFGPKRRIAIARELTKLHESIEVIFLEQAAAWVKDDAHRQRGEFVLIIEASEVEPVDNERIDRLLGRLLAHLPLSSAVTLAAELFDHPRKVLYARALELRSATSLDKEEPSPD